MEPLLRQFTFLSITFIILVVMFKFFQRVSSRLYVRPKLYNTIHPILCDFCDLRTEVVHKLFSTIKTHIVLDEVPYCTLAISSCN